MKKYRGQLDALLVIAYILVIGDMVYNFDKYAYRETWLHILNIILLCIGGYSIVKKY